MIKSNWVRIALPIGLLLFVGSSASADPLVTNVSLRGLQIGATTTLMIDGSDLLPDPKLLLSVPVATQRLLAGASATRITLEVALSSHALPGFAHLRVVTSRGISNSILMGCDDLPQVPFAPRLSTLPIALHGNLSGSSTLETHFVGKKGQRIVVDMEARRLGAVFDPIIELYDSRRVQLSYSAGHASLGGDARLDVVLPADGSYSVAMHDLLYRAGTPDYFRLKIGELSYADLAYPLGGRRGTQLAVQLVGNLTSPANLIQADLRESKGDLPVPLSTVRHYTGTVPALIIDDLPEVYRVEQDKGKLQEVQPPAVINGRIARPGEEDQFRLHVQPGTRLSFDVLANRAGSPLDAVLAVRNEAGGQVAAGDDRPDTVDPGLEYAVPGGVASLIVAVRDLEGRGGPPFVYRLRIKPAGSPDFALSLMDDRIFLPRGGSGIVRVRINRMGYGGAIHLDVASLPAGVSVTGMDVPPGADAAILTFTATNSTSVPPRLLTIVGRGEGTAGALWRTALAAPTAQTSRQPWLRSELVLASGEPAPLQIAWQPGEPALALGATYPAKVQVRRSPGISGAVRLSLLTSQVVPRTADGKQEDRNRAIRLEGVPTIAAKQDSTVANMLVPADLPAIPYDLALQADLLGPDGRTVLASANTGARRLPAVQPFALQLAGGASVKARSGSGATGKLVGKVNRAGGFSRPITVTLLGLPADLPVPSVVVPAERGGFELPVAFPFETKLGPIPNVNLVATSSVGGNRLLQSNAVPLAIEVVAGDPPPPAPALLRVFEDEPGFMAGLTEGDGQASLETVDRFAGVAALRVSGSQRLRTKMPGWGFAVREKPAPGEFRYLRFAWKKRGGANIMLQLNAGGRWGPPRGQPGPSYRYEAGPADNSFQAAAVRLDSRLPDEWTVVTRDLFADFGSFQLTGIALTPGPGDYGLFDHIYLARTLEDFKQCPTPVPPRQPRVIFEDQAEFVANLLEGAGTATLDLQDKYAGKASIKVTPDQRFNERLFGRGIRISQDPGFGEYRFLRFAWKKKGGQTICLQLNHDGQWGPAEGGSAKFRYHAGPAPEPFGASILIDGKLPDDWVVVTRDLFADFGEFNLTGLALSPVDGDYALFDHLYLGRSSRDFELVRPKKPPATTR